MDHKKAYEQTIASKLEALPLPDMADAIWSRIGTQLDIDMPTDDGDGSGPGSPSGGSWLGRTGLFVFIAALVTTFLIYQNNKKTESLFQPERTTQPTQAPSLPANTNNIIREERTRPGTSLPQSHSIGEVNTGSADSASNITVPVLPPPDSARQITVIPPPGLPVADTIQPQKKGRGVTGITDDDYRIVPVKKDST